MGLRAGTYGLNFCYDFWKLFLKIETDKLCGNVYFFQLVPKNKSYAQISSKQGRGGSKKKLQKFEYFPHILYFFSNWKALIHSIWTCYKKVMDNLIFWALGASS